MPDNIMVIAAEISADHHAAELLSELRKLRPNLHFWGIGGEALQEQGMEICIHQKEMSFLGLGEIIRHLPFLYHVKNRLLQRAEQDTPQCAILVDYPGFNLRMARWLKKRGIPVIYYISPQLWAWGKRRIKRIRRDVDVMMVLFPFEERFYARHDVKARYVGHPLLDKHFHELPQHDKPFDAQNVTLGLLPGSRPQEVAALLPEMIATARLLKNRGRIHQAEIVCVDTLPEGAYRRHLNTADTFIRLIKAPFTECLPRYDAALVASGTATLECGLYALPMVIVYRVHPLTYYLGRLLVKIPYIGLVNIVGEKELAVELIQHDFTAQRAADELEKLLTPEGNRGRREALRALRELLGEPGAARHAAETVVAFLDARGKEKA